MNPIDNSIVRGALAGAVATVPMTWLMVAGKRYLPESEISRPLPPAELMEDIERKTGVALDSESHRAAVYVSHFGYGASSGVLFALTMGRLRRIPVWVSAPAFGIAVWAASYLGWIPAVGSRAEARKSSGERNSLMLVSHLVWGLAIASLIRRKPSEIVHDAMSGVSGSSRASRMIQTSVV
jgi:uncharacterized membrane protein YagU involved in acid resistance